ncbi:hypothetical protein FRC18_002402 [Serendipita sp. 400]|nr:hypothetical protein FRC18_002402 [Serendipita sp. 400]
MKQQKQPLRGEEKKGRVRPSSWSVRCKRWFVILMYWSQVDRQSRTPPSQPVSLTTFALASKLVSQVTYPSQSGQIHRNVSRKGLRISVEYPPEQYEALDLFVAPYRQSS